MAKAKISKKCTADILKHVQKIEPTISKNTTWDEAWDILSQAWEFEADLAHTIKDKTIFTLYRDGLAVATYKLGDMWDEKTGDFNYTDIFRTVLDDVTKRRLYKRAKLGKRAQKEYDEKVAKAKKSRMVQENDATDEPIAETVIEPIKKRKKTAQKSTQTEKVTKCTVEKKNSVKSKKNK